MKLATAIGCMLAFFAVLCAVCLFFLADAAEFFRWAVQGFIVSAIGALAVPRPRPHCRATGNTPSVPPDSANRQLPRAVKRGLCGARHLCRGHRAPHGQEEIFAGVKILPGGNANHDLGTVRAIAEDVVVMKDGRVVEQGDKETVSAPPHHPHTDLLLASAPEMDPDRLTGLLDRHGIGNLGVGAAKRM